MNTVHTPGIWTAERHNPSPDDGTLPDGARYLHLDYDGTHEDYVSKPVALAYQGRTYVRASHNSDTWKVCYRTDFHHTTVQA